MELSPNDLITVLEELHKACTKWYYIGLTLKVPASTLDGIEAQSNDPKKCLLRAVQHWLRTVDPKPTWQALADALGSCLVEEHHLASSIEEKYCPRSKTPFLLTRVKDTLKVLQKDVKSSEEKTKVIQGVVDDFITESLQSGQSLESVQEQLQILHKEELLITKDVYKKAEELAIETHTQLSSADSCAAVVSGPTVKTSEPLFSKDTVYHAGICSLAVTTCDAGNYQSFFKKGDLVPGHSFRAVSISRSKENHYLVARQDDSTYYFAFQSQPKLLEWQQSLSFNEGIKNESDKFPVRFIVELLNKQCRIVLTGFSFGALLASTVAAQVWDLPYISSDLLKENLACITFGQPHVALQIVQTVAMQRPDFTTTIHTVYSQDDCVPQVMRFLDESWSSVELLQGVENSGVQHKVPEHMKAPLQDATTSLLLQYLGKLQANVIVGKCFVNADAEGLSELNRVASKLAAGRMARQLPHSSTSYLISSPGLVWNKLTEEQAHAHNQLGVAKIGAIVPDLFKEHSMAAYNKKLFNSFLDKDQKYNIPSAPAHVPGDVGHLKPFIESVELHHLGSETAIVLEGINLWFSYQVSIGGQLMKTPARDITGSSIQFNLQKENCKIATEDGNVKVVLHSHFAKVVKQEVTANVKPVYNVSSRQQQLARLTPSKLIELAYLSALLEQYPHSSSQPLSHKVEVIRKFLEEVVQVVPLESILYAIANGNHNVVLSCSKALIACDLDLSPSALMIHGFEVAAMRTKLGIPPSLLLKTENECKERFPDVPPYFVPRKEESGKITCDVFPRIPRLSHPTNLPQLAQLKCSPDELESVDNPEIIEVGDCLAKIRDRLHSTQHRHPKQVVSGLNIVLMYPISRKSSQQSDAILKSPLDILIDGRKRLATLAISQFQAEATSPTEMQSTDLLNQKMLEAVNNIRNNDLATCTALLGGFMELQEVNIPLVKSWKANSSTALKLSAAATVGVWALFSLNYSDIHSILSKCQGDQLLVKIHDYIKTVLGSQSVAPDDAPYTAKLQFMVQGMTKSVTCNSQYITYSFERQLVDLCKKREIDTSFSPDGLTTRWSKLFKKTTFSLIALSHRPLIARWLKWALMVHNLREELAKYTAVGVAGLVNSGKSVLVNTLFGISIPTGTTEVKRTTVPFMYNLDAQVEGLDVVDFPGVDDEDDTIGDLADLLVTIAQIIIFVVDYRKAHTKSVKEWLKRLQEEKVPVLVCLTFGDKLYAEHMKQGRHLKEEERYPPVEYMRHTVKKQLLVIQDKLQSAHSQRVQFFSFNQDNDSVLNSEEGRQRLRDVGIGTPLEVGKWLVEVFRKDFGEEKLADQLDSFVHAQ